MEPELQKYLKLLIKMSIGVLVLLAVYLLLVYVFPLFGGILAKLPVLLAPFIIALVIAVLVEPLVNFFEIRIRLRRSWAVIFSLVLSVGGFFYIVSALIVKVIDELSGLYPRMMAYSDQTINQFISAIGDIRLFYLQLDLPLEVEKTLQDNLENAMNLLKSFMETTVNSMVQILTALPNMFIFIMIATVATYLIIKDRALIRTFLFSFIPAAAQSQTRQIVAELFQALIGFFKAYSILISITGLLTIVGLRIMGIDYYLTIGIVTGLLDILPIVGPGTLFVPWIIWELMTGKTKMAVSLLILYIIISAVRQFSEPKILGDNIGLHPLATLIALYMGLKLGGIAGMIAGPVLVVIVIACYRAGIFNSLLRRKI
ncbi:MAG: sporulation integral membrane protein YtvI [Syntrophomonadaceae bacterium]|nr:sporulation integral membrane protein YtvI [Syntrophomonadaceae bacterium]